MSQGRMLDVLYYPSLKGRYCSSDYIKVKVSKSGVTAKKLVKQGWLEVVEVIGLTPSLNRNRMYAYRIKNDKVKELEKEHEKFLDEEKRRKKEIARDARREKELKKWEKSRNWNS